MKKLLSLILAGVVCFSLAACTGTKKSADNGENESAKTKIEEVKDGKLTVGVTIYEPMNYKDSNDKWTGFDTEFAEAVAKKLGAEAEFVVIDWDNKFLELESGNIDCIWNGMTITDEVKNNADVSKAYVKNAQVVVMNKDNVGKYKTEESLRGLKFAAEAGSAGEEAIKDKGLDGAYTACSAQSDALLEVKSGSADACVIDITMANAMTGEGTSYADLAKAMELTSEEYGIAFKKGSELTEKVNGIMDELKADGTLSKVAEKYNLTLAF